MLAVPHVMMHSGMTCSLDPSEAATPAPMIQVSVNLGIYHPVLQEYIHIDGVQ